MLSWLRTARTGRTAPHTAAESRVCCGAACPWRVLAVRNQFPQAVARAQLEPRKQPRPSAVRWCGSHDASWLGWRGLHARGFCFSKSNSDTTVASYPLPGNRPHIYGPHVPKLLIVAQVASTIQCAHFCSTCAREITAAACSSTTRTAAWAHARTQASTHTDKQPDSCRQTDTAPHPKQYAYGSTAAGTRTSLGYSVWAQGAVPGILSLSCVCLSPLPPPRLSGVTRQLLGGLW